MCAIRGIGMRQDSKVLLWWSFARLIDLNPQVYEDRLTVGSHLEERMRVSRAKVCLEERSRTSRGRDPRGGKHDL